jgi:hypothetical protein
MPMMEPMMERQGSFAITAKRNASYGRLASITARAVAALFLFMRPVYRADKARSIPFPWK